MDLFHCMSAFARVVEAGSFARAAETLEISRAIVTTRVMQLESHLGVRLLHRTTRRIALTDEGRAYYERCVRVLGDVAEAEESLSNAQASPRGRLRVDVPVAFARMVLTPALPRFFARYPELHLEVATNNRVVDLIEEGVDCAVRAVPLADSSLVARPIGTARMVTCAAPAYLARRGSPRHPDDLARHNCIGLVAPGTGRIADWVFEARDATLHIAPRGNLSVSSMEAAVDAALAGVGIAQVFSSLAHGPIMSGALVPLLVDCAAPGPPVTVVYPRSRYLSAKVRAFADFAAEIFPAESWWRDIVACARRAAKRSVRTR